MLELPPEFTVKPFAPVYPREAPVSDNRELIREVAPFALGKKLVVKLVEVVFPDPDGAWQLPSPRRKVVDEQVPVQSPMMSVETAAVNGEVPLPFTGPVRVPAPVPPEATGTMENEVVGEEPAPPPSTN